MKTTAKHLFLLSFASLCLSCGNEVETEEPEKELRLSVSGEEAHSITTPDVDYTFEILEGNGGYTATVSQTDGDNDANVTIEGNKVTVNLLVGNGMGAKITIADQKGKRDSLYIESTNASLAIPGFGVYIDKGDTYTLKYFEFGAGAPYTLERVRGNAAEAVVNDGKITITSLGLGDTYYKVRDWRGSVALLTVQTSLTFKMTSTYNYLEISAINNLTATVTLQWGDGWEIIGSTGKVTEDLSVDRPYIANGERAPNYVLFIHTIDKGKGKDTITLKDKSGNLAVVIVDVR